MTAAVMPRPPHCYDPDTARTATIEAAFTSTTPRPSVGMVARTAVTALATHHPQLLIGGNWARHVGTDDGFTAAVVTTV
jgi:hypothetical protein